MAKTIAHNPKKITTPQFRGSSVPFVHVSQIPTARNVKLPSSIRLRAILLAFVAVGPLNRIFRSQSPGFFERAKLLVLRNRRFKTSQFQHDNAT